MEGKNPIIPLLNQLVEIMSMIQNSKKGLNPIPQKIVEELERLEKELKDVQEQTKELTGNTNLDPTNLLIETMLSSKVPESDKSAIRRAIKAGRDVEILKKEVEKVAQKRSPRTSLKKTEDQSSQASTRRKKFKSLEDNKKWV